MIPFWRLRDYMNKILNVLKEFDIDDIDNIDMNKWVGNNEQNISFVKNIIIDINYILNQLEIIREKN